MCWCQLKDLLQLRSQNLREAEVCSQSHSIGVGFLLPQRQAGAPARWHFDVPEKGHLSWDLSQPKGPQALPPSTTAESTSGPGRSQFHVISMFVPVGIGPGQVGWGRESKRSGSGFESLVLPGCVDSGMLLIPILQPRELSLRSLFSSCSVTLDLQLLQRAYFPPQLCICL